MDNRRGRVKWGVNGTRSVTAYTYWRQAIKWNRDAENSGERRRVFCASLADVFEDWKGHIVDSKGNPLWWPENYEYNRFDIDEIPTFSHHTEAELVKMKLDLDDWRPLTLETIRRHLFRLVELTPNLIWMLLTKRPENIMTMVPESWQNGFPKNVWVGTSVENQEMAIERIPVLNRVPAVVRFLSVEPMLGPVDITNKGIKNGYLLPTAYIQVFGTEKVGIEYTDPGDRYIGIELVICGGESGTKKRPFDIEWGRSLRDQCKGQEGVSFFFKQVDKVRPIPEDLMIREIPGMR